MEKITPAARGEFSFPGPVDLHHERGDEQNKNGNDERQSAFQSTQSKRIPAMLSTHEAKNDEMVIRVVRFPRRRVGRRRGERLPARERSPADASDIDGETQKAKSGRAHESKLAERQPRLSWHRSAC